VPPRALRSIGWHFAETAKHLCSQISTSCSQRPQGCREGGCPLSAAPRRQAHRSSAAMGTRVLAGRPGSPATNHLLENLRAAGYAPSQVDEIYSSHFHGDHIGSVQFMSPSLVDIFDLNAGQAAMQRRRIYAMAATRHRWLAGAHLSFPGLGHLRAEQGSFVWVPINYEETLRIHAKQLTKQAQ
jgi:hypothetical protein